MSGSTGFAKCSRHTLDHIMLRMKYRLYTQGHNVQVYNIMYNTSAMLSIFGRAGEILLAVVDVSHALYT